MTVEEFEAAVLEQIKLDLIADQASVVESDDELSAKQMAEQMAHIVADVQSLANISDIVDYIEYELGGEHTDIVKVIIAAARNVALQQGWIVENGPTA